jgi:hypothetical protein
MTNKFLLTESDRWAEAVERCASDRTRFRRPRDRPLAGEARHA